MSVMPRPGVATRTVEPVHCVVAVGVDGTPSGWAALAWAVSEVAAGGGRLVVCRVRPEPVPSGARPDPAALQLADPPLARAVRSVRDRLGGHRVEVVLPAGDPVAVLDALAADADLLVLGAGERKISLPRLLGSTALRVAAHARAPVVLVRPLPSGRRGPFAGHVVAGVDGSPAAHAALEFGFRFAAAHRVPLVAVHVATEVPENYWVDDRMLETHFVAEPPGLALLSVEIEPLTRQYPQVAVKRAGYGGRAVPGLVAAAEGARLLVVGARGRRLPPPLLLGSVSQGVAATAGCPVAVVPVRRCE
jgi:nucleotide-binding universal stress UspA family protein